MPPELCPLNCPTEDEAESCVIKVGVHNYEGAILCNAEGELECRLSCQALLGFFGRTEGAACEADGSLGTLHCTPEGSLYCLVDDLGG